MIGGKTAPPTVTAMPDNPDAPGRLARQIDELCREFEDGWRTGRPIPIEDLLAGAPEEARPGLLRAALELEREYRETAAPLSPDEAHERFGGLGPWAAAILDDLFPPEPMLV